ncbi:hypothetical protein CVD28_02990 [Bacillus sp. M6-12]|uniref:hypothetical protein n=1 Tax=Bacillus sp. M6-12 TaxID=2054166 RepID=UPI000C75F84D|nr:hypothetical protein [Bacillus sp. M6-12]PLS19396.1 hypothetical protein CVD28_02990 [Bacillus sp. M6-12]
MKPIVEFINEKIEAIDETELESSDLKAIANEVIDTYKTQCKVFHAGSFDNPGYSIDGYIISYIDELGELQGISVDIERC